MESSSLPSSVLEYRHQSLPAHATRPFNQAVNMISVKGFIVDPSQLISPQSTLVRVLVKSSTTLVAPVNYFQANPFIIYGPTSINQESLTHGLTHHIHCIPSSLTPVLIIEGSGAEHIVEIGGVTRTGRVYQPKDLTERRTEKESGRRP